MCGIVGIFSQASCGFQRLSSHDVERLSHRGPDGQGIYNDDYISLGHRRLSILDLSPEGAQPKSTKDGRYTVTFNGEIYNYIELRKELMELGERFYGSSDTEVLLAAYRIWGRACVERFRGMFAFALYDKEARILFMARDRCGEKPFFYYRDQAGFYFASELKALLPLLPQVPDLEPSVVDMYLHYQYVPEPLTLLSDVHKLPAAHTLTISSENWNAEPARYWSIDSIPAEHLPDPLIDKGIHIKNALEDAVKMTLRSDVPVGVALSGGIDSSAIALFAQRNSSQPLHAFCVGYPGRPAHDEREQAKAFAKQQGMIIHEVELPVDGFVDFFPELVKIMDEPIADIAAFGHYAVPAAAARSGIKVLLSGIGGDELFWGYPWARKAAILNQWRVVSPFILEKIVRSKIGRKFVSRLVPDFPLDEAIHSFDTYTPQDQLYLYAAVPDFLVARLMKERVSGVVMRTLHVDNVFAATKTSHQTPKTVPATIIRLLFDTWLSSNCLSLGDRVSMGVGVETRMPFLDIRLVETVMALRQSTPDHRLGHKAWLRDSLQGVLPDEVLARPKSGFQPPVIDWLQGVVKRYATILPEGYLSQAGIIDPLLIDRFIKDDVWDYSRLFFVYKLILLEMWYALVVKGGFCMGHDRRN